MDTTAKKKKKVCFNNFVLVHLVNYVDRRGCWVIDRVRFERRILETEEVLRPIL